MLARRHRHCYIARQVAWLYCGYTCRLYSAMPLRLFASRAPRTFCQGGLRARRVHLRVLERFFLGELLKTAMLVLSRKVGERILIGNHVTVTVVRITGGGVRIGIEAPPEMAVIREELQDGLRSRVDPPQQDSLNRR